MELDAYSKCQTSGVSKGRSESNEGDACQLSIISVDEDTENHSSAKWRVDTDALTGLRGLVALHIALGHMFYYSRLSIDLQGGISMSLFYLLSGFIMSVAYGAKALKDKKKEENNTLEVLDTSPTEARSPIIDKWIFWRNRFARLYPMYFLTNLAQVPINYVYIGSFSDESFSFVNIILTVTGTNLWVFPFNPDMLFPLNGVTWTIQTMWFFYLVFPTIFPLLLQMNDLFQKIRIMYYVQLAFYFLPFVIYIPLFGEDGGEVAYWVARGWPLSRLPVFVMGCLAGIERVHHKNNDRCGQIKSTVIGCCCSSKIVDSDAEEKFWDRSIGNRSAFLYLILIGAIVLSSVLVDDRIGEICRPCGEALAPLLFICLIFSLTDTINESLAQISNVVGDSSSKMSGIEYICRSKAATFLGNISLCFYLVHMQVVEWTDIIYRFISFDNFFDSFEDQMDWPPIWIIPVNLIVSLLLGYALTYMIEKPLQSIIRRE